ncbi:MAG: ABC transporter permease, partial [Arenicella sp.]|nr:ABC transporter permease [Arenicella sp.]
QISYFTLLFRVVWRNLIVLSYQMLMFGILALILMQPITANWLLLPLGLLLITFTALSAGVMMSVFATRFRDISELFNNILRLVFFATPIMWMPVGKLENTLITNLNPFYHMIEIFRGPLLKETLTWSNWIVVINLMIFGWMLAFPIFARYRSRIAFWL